MDYFIKVYDIKEFHWRLIAEYKTGFHYFPNFRRHFPKRANLFHILTWHLILKAELSLHLTKHHATKTYWGSGGIATHILNLGTRLTWVASFTHRPLYLGTKWVGGWVGPRASLDAVARRWNPAAAWNRIPVLYICYLIPKIKRFRVIYTSTLFLFLIGLLLNFVTAYAATVNNANACVRSYIKVRVIVKTCYRWFKVCTKNVADWHDIKGTHNKRNVDVRDEEKQ
jgi:hypothetical protein